MRCPSILGGNRFASDNNLWKYISNLCLAIFNHMLFFMAFESLNINNTLTIQWFNFKLVIL